MVNSTREQQNLGIATFNEGDFPPNDLSNRGQAGTLTGSRTTATGSGTETGTETGSTTFIPQAGIEYQNQMNTDILKRFYDILIQIFDSEEYFTQKVSDFFQLENQLLRDPEKYLQPDEYFINAIGLFYLLGLNTNDNQFQLKNSEYSPNEIWLRYCSKLVMIKLDEKSGSLYQSPFESTYGMIYLGRDVDESGKESGYWFCMEGRKGLKYLTNFYMTRSSPLHWIKDSILPHLTFTKSITENKLAENILNGEISDAEIECKDGKIQISKSLFCLHSDYFLSLFKLEKKFTYHMDLFEKEILIYYLYFCCEQAYYFDPKLVLQYIAFGEYVQDQSFIKNIYQEIYQNRSCYTNKDLIEFIKNFQKIGLEIKILLKYIL